MGQENEKHIFIETIESTRESAHNACKKVDTPLISDRNSILTENRLLAPLLSLRKACPLLKSPPGVGQTLPRRGQKSPLLSLRKACKLLKSLGIFTPPPPPPPPHCVISFLNIKLS